MIVLRRTGFIIKEHDSLLALSEYDIKNIISEEKSGEIDFAIPSEFKTNKERNIYKVGFLVGFLKYIYPDENFDVICNILNTRYQVFIGRRQIERLLSTYNSEPKFNK